MCDYCTHFHAEHAKCGVCGKKPTATATKPTRTHKTAAARGKASSSWLTQLRAAGMPDDSAIVAGLGTGAVVQAIGSQANYQHVIDYLEIRGYEVAGYRARIVCGSEYLTE